MRRHRWDDQIGSGGAAGCGVGRWGKVAPFWLACSAACCPRALPALPSLPCLPCSAARTHLSSSCAILTVLPSFFLPPPQLIVVTPEKWDIITRKSGDRAYTQLVGALLGVGVGGGGEGGRAVWQGPPELVHP